MVYENALTPISGAAAFLSKSVKYNSLYDFDNGTGDLGNKQPLYFDTFLQRLDLISSIRFIAGKPLGLL